MIVHTHTHIYIYIHTYNYIYIYITITLEFSTTLLFQTKLKGDFPTFLFNHFFFQTRFVSPNTKPKVIWTVHSSHSCCTLKVVSYTLHFVAIIIYHDGWRSILAWKMVLAEHFIGETHWDHQTIRDDLATCFAFWSPERVDPTHSFLFFFCGWLAC